MADTDPPSLEAKSPEPAPVDSFTLNDPGCPSLEAKVPEYRHAVASGISEPLRDVVAESLEPTHTISNEWLRPTGVVAFGLLDPPRVSDPQNPEPTTVVKAESPEPGEIVTPPPQRFPQDTPSTAAGSGTLKRRIDDFPDRSPRPNPYERYDARLFSRERGVTYSSTSPPPPDSDERLFMRAQSKFPSQHQDGLGTTGSPEQPLARDRAVCPSFSHAVKLSYDVTNFPPKVVSLDQADVEDWSSEKVMFTFEVLSLTAHLNPKFEISTIGRRARSVKCVLTLYGHTISVGPVECSDDAIRAMACQKALVKLQISHGQWTVPQMPTEQQYPAERDTWEKLLGTYLAEHKRGQPRYSLIAEGDEGWHCDVEVEGRVFCTGTAPKGFVRAREMGARAVLHHLLVASGRVARSVPDAGPLIREKISFSSGELEDMKRTRKSYETKFASRDQEFAPEPSPASKKKKRLPGTKANRTPLGNPRWKPAEPGDTRPTREIVVRLPPRGPAESHPLGLSRSKPASRSSSASRPSRPSAASLSHQHGSPSRAGNGFSPKDHRRE